MGSLIIKTPQVTGKLLLEKDWSTHALGPIEKWPSALIQSLKNILNQKNPMQIFWGPEGYCFYNDAHIPILGSHKHPVAFGELAEKVWQEAWTSVVQPQIAELMKSGSATWQTDLLIPLERNGVLVNGYFSFGFSPIYNELGEIGGVLVTGVETTATADALKQSESRFKQIAESLPQLVWSCRPDGLCNYLSQQWEEYTGMKQDEQLGYDWISKVIHPDDREMTLNHWMGAVKGIHPYDIEYRVKRRDGVYRWFKTRGTTIKNELGEITNWFGTCTDIEDTKSAQLQYEKYVDTSPAMLWITDAEGSCTYLSNQWYEITGQTPETGLGHGWLDVTHPDDKEEAEKIFIKANSEQRIFRTEYRLKDKKGEYRWAIDAANPRFDKNGKYLGMAGTVFDVHERKLAEERAESARNRILELARSLQEAVTARDEFLSIASHELKTPLTSLKLQAQIHTRAVKKQDPKAYEPEYVNHLVAQTEMQVHRLTRLVDDMLDVSRIQSGKLNIEKESLNLSELVENVIDRFREQFHRSFIPVPKINFDKNAVGNWDRMRIEQVVMNLITNAIRYGNNKPITFTITSEDEKVRLMVEDQGRGIAENAKDKIFERFERAVTANEVSGLGLGLFITRQIIHAHGGSISVKSKLGIGSTFTVELPKDSDRQ